MTTNTMGRDKAVECPECGRKWPWESEQAVAVGLQGACIACTSRYPDGAHEESQRRHSSIAALRDGEAKQPAAVVDEAAVWRVIAELRAYNPAADEHKGAHIHKVWAKELAAALAQQPAETSNAREWQNGEAAPECPTITDDEPVKLLWRDDEGRRCTTWASANEIGRWKRAAPRLGRG